MNTNIIDKRQVAKIISKNLKRIMVENNCTQVEVARDLNINKATISSWVNGTRIPRMDKIDLLCHYFNCTRAEIMDEEPAQTTQALRIPVYGRVAAGIPIEAIENISDWEEIPASWQGKYSGLKVKGDSMVPMIQDGDVLIVKNQSDAESGDIVIALINGEDATVKKLLKQGDGIVLQPLNPAYEPKYFSKENQETIPVTIWGKVIEIRRSL